MNLYVLKVELNFMVRSLIRYQEQSIHLDTLTIEAPEFAGFRTYYDLLIDLATKNSPRNLTLIMPSFYKLPKPVFEVESLVNLDLSHCTLDPDRILWPNVRKLRFYNVRFYGGVFEMMIRRCTLLETLDIQKCCFDHAEYDFNVANLRNLKDLRIKLFCDYTLEVDALPALNSIYCYGKNSRLKLSSSEYQSLRSLSIHSIRIEDDIFTDFAQRFPRLENLCIEHNKTLEKLVIFSPSLKVMKMTHNMALMKAQLDVPNLVFFEYKTSSCAGCNFIPDLSIAGSSSGWKSGIELNEYRNNSIDASWFLKLHSFLAALEESQISVTINFKKADNIIEHSEFFPQIIPSVHEFSIVTDWEVFDVSSAYSVLTGIFKIIRPERLTFRPWNDSIFRTIPVHNVKYLWDAAGDTANCKKIAELLEAQKMEGGEIFTMVFKMEY